MKFAPVKKTIYSLAPLRALLAASNRLSGISVGHRRYQLRDRQVEQNHSDGARPRSYRGFSFFDAEDETLFIALSRGEFTISGVQNKMLRRLLPHYNSAQLSRIVRRLRTHGLIKKAAHCYEYCLTTLGKQVIALGLKLKQTGDHPSTRCPTRPLIPISYHFRQESDNVGTHGQISLVIGNSS